MEQPQLTKGFDRGVDYIDMKTRLINEYKTESTKFGSLDSIVSKRTYNASLNKLIYLTVAMIQLSNGCRISEACEAIHLFLDKGVNAKVLVKIAKSQAIKTNKQGEKVETKARYRHIKFPRGWITLNDRVELFKSRLEKLPNLKYCVLNYLLRNFECNTHSLRYAFINYMLYSQEKPMSVVAKFVGHSNINQLVTYTQNKESDKLFDIMDQEG